MLMLHSVGCAFVRAGYLVVPFNRKQTHVSYFYS